MELLTPEEVAERLKVTPRWVRDHRYELGGVMLGTFLRFTVEGLEEAVQRMASEQAEASVRVQPIGGTVRPRPPAAATVERVTLGLRQSTGANTRRRKA